MKLCISASGREIDAMVDPAFGRAPFFHIYDTGSMELHVVDNSAAGGQGVGLSAARTVADLGVDAVLTGALGANALEVLQSRNITIYQGASARDSVQEALAKYMRGDFGAATGPSGSQGRAAAPGQGMGRGDGQCRAQGGQGRGMGMGGGRGRCRR